MHKRCSDTSFSVTPSDTFEAISSKFVRTRIPNSHVEGRLPISAHGANYNDVIGEQPYKAVRQSPDLLFIATSFWFEESPCAVRTNTAGLGRLCTFFVCSTLLVFEHTHAVLSSTLVLCCTIVTTSTAAMSNYRYADTDRMKNVFLIRFSKPHLDRTKAGR